MEDISTSITSTAARFSGEAGRFDDEISDRYDFKLRVKMLSALAFVPVSDFGFPQRHWLQLPYLNLLNYRCFLF